MGMGGEQEATPRFAAIMITIISRGLIELGRKKERNYFRKKIFIEHSVITINRAMK